MWHVSFLGLVAQFSHFSRSVVIARWSIISMFLSMLPFTFYGLCSRFSRLTRLQYGYLLSRVSGAEIDMPPPLSLLRDRENKIRTYIRLSRASNIACHVMGFARSAMGFAICGDPLISGTAASRHASRTQRRRQNARATQQRGVRASRRRRRPHTRPPSRLAPQPPTRAPAPARAPPAAPTAVPTAARALHCEHRARHRERRTGEDYSRLGRPGHRRGRARRAGAARPRARRPSEQAARPADRPAQTATRAARRRRHLGGHGTPCVPNARGWYTYPVRTQRGRLARVARTYPTEAPGRACQLRAAQGGSQPVAAATCCRLLTSHIEHTSPA